MQPQQPQQQPGPQPQYASDYLDQIAAKPVVKTINPMFLWVGIGGFLLLVIILTFAILGSSSNTTPKQQLNRFGAEITSLEEVSKDAQKNIQSGELRSTNSSLTLITTNTKRDLTDPLATLKISLKNKKGIENATVAKETKELSARLDDARLNGVFDRTYAREMSFYIKKLRSEMSIIYTKTKSKSLRSVLETSDANYKSLQESFDSYNGS